MNQLMRFEDLREWLMSQIDGSEETRGDDGLISHFINQIDALSSEITEPKGCPTPGACSAVEELADLKQRILPQFQGRAQRAEHERDGMLEKLTAAIRDKNAAQIAAVNAEQDAIAAEDKLAALSATGEPDRPDWARQLLGAEIFDRAARGGHAYDRSASLNAGKYVCTCGGACSHYDAGGKP